MLGLKAAHASWELKGLLLLPEKIPSWRWGALPRVGSGQASPLFLFPSRGVGAVLASGSGCVWAENSASSSPPHLETAQEVSFMSQGI